MAQHSDSTPQIGVERISIVKNKIAPKNRTGRYSANFETNLKNEKTQDETTYPPLGDFSSQEVNIENNKQVLPKHVLKQSLSVEVTYETILANSNKSDVALWVVIKPVALPLLAYRYINNIHTDNATVIYDNERVISVNHIAYDGGIRVGMPLNQVLSIIDRCTLLKRSPLLEKKVLKSIALILEMYSNELCLNNDNIAFEVGRSLSLFQGIEALLNSVNDKLKNQIAAFNIGAALTIEHAIWQANVNELAQLENTDRHKLTQLPLSYIDIKPKELERLHAMGLFTYGDIKRLPQRLFNERISDELKEKLKRANGESRDVRKRYQRTKQFALKTEFDYPVTEITHLMPIITWAVQQLSDELKTVNMGVYSIIIGFININRHIDWHVIRLTKITYQYQKLINIVENKIQGCIITSPIDGICLLTGPYQHLTPSTMDLFQLSNFKLDNLCDVLLSRLGESRLKKLKLQKDHLPERQTLLVPLIHERTKNSENNTRTFKLHNFQPIWLYSEPIELHNLNYIHGEKYELHRYPNRIETGWWRNEWCLRDYFLATTETGKRYWTFHQHKKWYLHGQFF